MIRKDLVDDFFNNQPERLFQKDLCRYDFQAIYSCDTLPENQNDFFVKSICLDKGLFEGTENLKVVWFDWESFLGKNGLKGEDYPVFLTKSEDFEEEEFELQIAVEKCKVLAGETEGIRRAMIRLQDMLCVKGGNLQTGNFHYKPKLRHRITRCFFSPTNRPPKNGDELSDDIDYYPDAYLNRLMHDGINGIWIYSRFDSLVKTSYIPEYGEGGDVRLEKLNRVIEKCARYGIKVFLFAMEPISMTEGVMKTQYPGIEKKYPQAQGGNRIGPIGFCTYTDFAKGYCSEAVKILFEKAPGLGGLMSITQGERVTTCSNTWPDREGNWINNCPHCGNKTRPEILSHTVNLMRDCIDEIKPSAEYISWTYAHRWWTDEDISYYVEHAPKDAILMQNFEDAGRVEQLGKTRIALDYWLSYAGPSHMFEHTAKEARKYGKTLYAKLQVCCSHECASVPYIPVPGIIYDKITKAIELGVQGVMESWYFGNYPCIMSKAVDLLSFGEKYGSKQEFLHYLAGLTWAKKDVDLVVSAWEEFEKGYTQYPINTMFGYYGPMHDGIVWDLSLLPKNFSLPRSWQLIDKTDGDRIGECLFNGHTIEEAVYLLDSLNACWKKGCEYLSQTSAAQKGVYNEQISVANALKVLFRSGRNVMRFYQLRNNLGYQRGNPYLLLKELREIVTEELQNCQEMIAFCQQDNRLGYHSEAEGFKFFPKKLERKIRNLTELLNTEFICVEERIKNGLSPIAYYDGEEESTVQYIADRTGIEHARWEDIGHEGFFRIAVEDEIITIELKSDKKAEFILSNEYELMFPQATVIIKKDGRLVLHRECRTHQSNFDDKIEKELAKWSVEDLSSGVACYYRITLKKGDVGFVRLPYKMMILANGESWSQDLNPVRVLGKSMITPGWFGWIT